ncbi:hypothetical protein ACFE04_006436 [Oxalis oulophora]
MAYLHHNFILLPLLITFIFFIRASSDSNIDELINKICRRNEDYGFCYKVFQENITPSTDIIDLGYITINEAWHNATDDFGYATKMLQRAKDRTEEMFARECVYGYNQVLLLTQLVKGIDK